MLSNRFFVTSACTIAFAGITIAFAGCTSAEETHPKDSTPSQPSATSPATQHQVAEAKDDKAHYEFDAKGDEYIVNPDGSSALSSKTHLEFDKDGNQFAVAPDGTVFQLGKK